MHKIFTFYKVSGEPVVVNALTVTSISETTVTDRNGKEHRAAKICGGVWVYGSNSTPGEVVVRDVVGDLSARRLIEMAKLSAGIAATEVAPEPTGIRSVGPRV